MKLPFTAEQFLEVFRNYNQAVFPIQIGFSLVGFLCIYLILKPNGNSNKITSILLSFLWLWMGIVYHVIFFTAINKAAYLFGGFFVIQGLIFYILGVSKNKLSFQFKKDKYGITGMLLILFSLIIYPILGYLFGHIYPNSPTFGLPCPTTIFTFGILLLNQKKCPIFVLVIPFIWSIIGFSAVFQFGIFEDSGLIVASLPTVFLLMYRNMKLQNDK